MGQWGFKCFNSERVEIHGMDQADCREKANTLGHRYYQYFASEKICATAATCEDGMRFSDGWGILATTGTAGAIAASYTASDHTRADASDSATAEANATTGNAGPRDFRNVHRQHR